MTTPTTRETADHIGEANEKVADHVGDATTMIDHAELARLAEAASGSEWQTYVSGRPEYRNVTHYVEHNPPCDLPFVAEVQEGRDAAFIAAANPATVKNLLSEIAALKKRLEWIYREADEMALNGVRLVQAERQRDEEIAVHTRIAAEVIEARRQRDEAVAVIKEVDQAARQAAAMNDAGYTVTVERTATHIYGITAAFLANQEADQ